MLTIAEAQKRTEQFLTGQMLEALRTVEYELPSFDAEPRALGPRERGARAGRDPPCARRSPTRAIWSRRLATSCLMQLQLNVHRLVVVYRVPALDALDANTSGGAARTLADRRRACRLEVRLARCAGRRRRRPALCRDLLLCVRRRGFSRKRAAAALLAHRHRADDALLHARSGALRASACRRVAPAIRCSGLCARSAEGPAALHLSARPVQEKNPKWRNR